MTPVPEQYRHLFDVDGLIASGATPHWFGLGFIQLKLDADTRLHFWHPELLADTSEEELHDHRYRFTSSILVGEITHEEWLFDRDEEGDHELVRVSCQPDKAEMPFLLARGTVKRGSEYVMRAGSEYTFSDSGFHRIRASRAVTYLRRGAVTKDYANVIRPHGKTSVCPFSNEIPKARLWECIRDLLGARKPGYHMRDIPKGTLGQASKIYEETLEFMDAIDQGAKVMALIELSDLEGAIRAYLKENHPSFAASDLEVMSNITERAFANGYR